MGRVSYELTQSTGGPWPAGSRRFVFSRTLRASDHPGVTVVADDAAGVVHQLRTEPGDGDIWLYGGGQLFAALLAAGQVDRVEVSVVPVLLGRGVPLHPAVGLAGRATLALRDTRTYPSGIVTLTYAVPGARR
jgi:dihydrofolate reductase